MPHIQKNITPAIRAPIGQRYMEHTSIQSDTIPSMHGATTVPTAATVATAFFLERPNLVWRASTGVSKRFTSEVRPAKATAIKKYRHHYSSSRHLGEHIRQVYEHQPRTAAGERLACSSHGRYYSHSCCQRRYSIPKGDSPGAVWYVHISF